MTKLLLPILFVSILLSGEMEVDGNLKVTGSVESTTIDSLKEVNVQLQQQISSLEILIAQLQAQIASLEAQMAFLGQDLNNADCAGVVGGSAVIDDCGICDGSNESMDVCGICGGETQNEEDCCIDVDGNIYTTVSIGTQTWMAENLRTTNDSQYNAIGYYCYEESLDNCDDYGRLYTWEILNNNDICPTGWHVPSDSAFTTLERYICSDIFGNDDCENTFPYVQEYNIWRGSNEAGAIKDGEIEFPPGWIYEVQSDNQTGFSAMPGGINFSSGYYANIGYSAYFWTSSLSEVGLPYFRTLTFENQKIRRDATASFYGMSVRCIKD